MITGRQLKLSRYVEDVDIASAETIRKYMYIVFV